MSYKDVAAESGLIVMDEAPVQTIKSDDLAAAIKRLRFIVPGGQKMQVESLTIIAQEAILYRVVPGRDMHYYEGRNGLVRIPDYKYLKNYALFKEQLMSGDSGAIVEERDRPLSEAERVQHGIQDHEIAAIVTIATPRERQDFAREVRNWRDMGFTPQEALQLARDNYGEVGTSAIGVVDPTELDRFGKPITPPKGWSFYQWAAKLALKNAINRKYGIPTADEMRLMAYAMAKRALPQDWVGIDPLEPVDVQARLADLEAISRESSGVDPAEVAANIEIMRGPDDGAIGEDYEGEDRARFNERVKFEIAYFTDSGKINQAIDSLDLIYDPKNEDLILAELAAYAEKQADIEAQ